jgi:hypothetical protein
VHVDVDVDVILVLELDNVVVVVVVVVEDDGDGDEGDGDDYIDDNAALKMAENYSTLVTFLKKVELNFKKLFFYYLIFNI